LQLLHQSVGSPQPGPAMTNPAPMAVSRTQLTITLAIAVVCLVAWALLAFVTPVGIGQVHVLLGAGVTLYVRWYALRNR
jgi:Flp pilus assembly protein TadB